MQRIMSVTKQKSGSCIGFTGDLTQMGPSKASLWVEGEGDSCKAQAGSSEWEVGEGRSAQGAQCQLLGVRARGSGCARGIGALMCRW